MKIVDANVVLRYLLQDEEALFKKARHFLENEEVFIPTEIFAEIVYILEKVYKIKRVEIAKILQNLINYPTIQVSNPKIIQESLLTYSTYNLDYADSLLVGYKMVNEFEIISFDKKLNSIIKKKSN